MCFIFDLFNSCSFNKKNSPSKKSSSNTNPTIDSSIKQQPLSAHPITTATKHSTLVKHLNEKTPLEFNFSNSNSNKLNTLETAEKLKDKFFKAKHYSKLESEPESCQHSTKSKNLKTNSNIVDFCNECGYYCCECKPTINTSNSDFNTNTYNTNSSNSFYIDNNTLNLYLNLHNSFVNQIINNDSELYSNIYSNQNCKTDHSQHISNDLTLNNIDSSSIKMKSNFNNLLSKDNKNNNKHESNLMLSSQSSFSSSISSNSNATTANKFNPFRNEINDVDMKLEDNNNNSKLDHIPFEKPHLNIFSQRQNTNDVEMDETYPTQQLQLQQPQFLTPSPQSLRPQLCQPSLFSQTNIFKQPQLQTHPSLTLNLNHFKKQQFVFTPAEDKILEKILIDSIEDITKHPSEIPRFPRYPNNRHHKPRDNKIIISSEQIYDFKESDLKDLGQIGYGEFGTVHKVMHIPSQTCMALKRIRPTVGSQRERKKVLKELDFVLECQDYTHVVKFYGVKLNNEPAENLICMELMDTSLEKFYKFVYDKKREQIPESILVKIVVATVNALDFLKEQHNIIHRDVKPSNILLNKQGKIKMCDFGISGKLVDSIAASRDAGCQLYMAPERIDPRSSIYDVRSDVWSLGITLYELSTGKFPYPQWKSIFQQLILVVESDAPRLEEERLSKDFCDFVNTCLTKDENKRPKYKELLHHPLILKHQDNYVNVSEYVTPYIDEMQKTG